MKKGLGFGAVMAVGLMLAAVAVAEEPAATPAASQPVVKVHQAVKSTKKNKKSKKKSKEVWACPMGDYVGAKTADGKCPQCGMDLVREKEPVKKEEGKEKAKPSAKADSKKIVWVCPMGDYSSDKPGKCPNCAMDLVEKK